MGMDPTELLHQTNPDHPSPPPPAAEEPKDIHSHVDDHRLPPSDSDDSAESTPPPANGIKAEVDGEEKLVRPPPQLPQPEAPPGVFTKSTSKGAEDYRLVQRSLSDNGAAGAAPVDVLAIGKYLRARGTALAKRISSSSSLPDESSPPLSGPVTEFHIPGLKVIVRMKDGDHAEEYEERPPDVVDFKGRITFFSRSNCRDCGAVRSFLREKWLPYVEINVDVFPSREKELVERTGAAAVPQIFFNEKLLGGLVALNSLRNSGEFERRLMEMAGTRCPDSAPRVPMYGFDDEEEEGKRGTDELVGIVRALRQRLPIQDRVTKMKLIRNCFAGSDLVEAVIQHLDCGRKKAIGIGKELARKHFIYHVFRENDFEDGNHFYRFLEHDPMIPRCFNFRMATNDDEPRPASLVGQQLTKLMFAILEAYASDDRRHLDYNRISVSEEFRRYVNVVHDLQRVDIHALSMDQRLAFFTNLYNAMVIHAVIRVGRPEGLIDRRSFYNDFHYIIGGYPYSLSTIKHGILRSNRRQPYSFAKPFGIGDKRLELALPKVNPLIHFGLCNATRSSPPVRFFSSEGIDVELRQAAREFFQSGGIAVDLEKRTVYLTRIIKWFNTDFGQEREILKWLLNFLDATKAGLLTHLLSDGSPVKIVYQDFDWSLNV